MKHYTFNLTKKEVLEFSIQTVLEQIKRRPAFWIISLLVFTLNILISLRLGLMIILWMLSFIILFILQTYLLMKKELHEDQRSIRVENAMLKMSLDIYNEIPLNYICTIRMSKHLIILGDHQSKKRITWYPIPFRVFESSNEQETFLELIRHPQQEMSKDMDSSEVKNEGRELFHFLSQLDDEKWVQLLKDERAVRTATLGKEKRYFIFLIIYSIFVILFALSWVLGDITQVLTISIFTLVVGVVFWLKNFYGNPDGKIRRQLKFGLLQNRIYKDCKISVFEHGVMIDTPEKRKSILPWDALGWLVETEFAFYLFKKDKVCYVIIPKECLENWGQAVSMCQLCEGKGIPILRGRKMKYTPNWVFYLLAFFVLIVYTQVSLWLTWLTAMYSNWRTAEQIHDFGTAENMWIEEFDPADYSDYEPLDIQVEVLRSLGFTVPQEVADWEQRRMDEYDMQVYVEGYPYTELLSVLGMPTYNDDYEVVGYSDEVLWFDFEGMDTRMDYIGILEGMKALAAGSCIDNVGNIQEDMSRVDWESGTGEITVSFEWQGCEYFCQMDMENDWIDEKVLGVFNSLLEQDNAEERFYITGDNGQGALVFFGTADWAVEFEKATGLDLDFYTSSLFKNITNTKLIEAIEENVILNDDTEIESYEWIDEKETCLRVRLQYKEKPADNYRHKEDYFFFLNDDNIQVLYVDYPNKDYENIDKDRYVWDACDFNAYFEDVTFDGYDDLIIFLGHAGVHGTCIYGAYIYENNSYRYESSFENIPNYEIDTENKCINGYNVDSAVSTTYFVYKYDNGEFIQVSENSETR